MGIANGAICANCGKPFGKHFGVYCYHSNIATEVFVEAVPIETDRKPRNNDQLFANCVVIASPGPLCLDPDPVLDIERPIANTWDNAADVVNDIRKAREQAEQNVGYDIKPEHVPNKTSPGYDETQSQVAVMGPNKHWENQPIDLAANENSDESLNTVERELVDGLTGFVSDLKSMNDALDPFYDSAETDGLRFVPEAFEKINGLANRQVPFEQRSLVDQLCQRDREISSLNQQLDQLRAKYDQERITSSNASAQRDSFGTEIDRLRKELGDKEEHFDKLIGERGESWKELTDCLCGRIATANQRLAELRSELAERKTYCEQVTTEGDNLRQEHTKQIHEVESLQKRIGDLNHTISNHLNNERSYLADIKTLTECRAMLTDKVKSEFVNGKAIGYNEGYSASTNKFSWWHLLLNAIIATISGGLFGYFVR